MQQSTDNEDDIILRGKFVIVRRTFEASSFKLVKIGNDKYCFHCLSIVNFKLKIEILFRFFYFNKQKINAESLINEKFGSTFELNSERCLVRVNLSDYLLNMKKDESNMEKDNRFIVDDNKSQKLTRNDIEKIKKETSGKEVIKILVENSSTFDGKNKFSQQKYLIKKQQKYLNLFTVLKPNVKFLMEMYFSQGPAKNKYANVCLFLFCGFNLFLI